MSRILPARCLQLEKLHDARAGTEADAVASWPDPLRPWADAVSRGDWSRIEACSPDAFSLLSDIVERAFALQWAIAACDVMGKESDRMKWLARWDQISDWYAHPFCL